MAHVKPDDRRSATGDRRPTAATRRPGTAAPTDTDLRRKLTTTMVLVLFALVAIAMATFAWFSIADSAKTRMLMIDANADGSLRFDLDEHATFDEYVHSLGFDQISARIASEKGVDIDASKLKPVTTSDYQTFTFEDGSTADPATGAYLEFTLHFMSSTDLRVRLTGQDGNGGVSGTRFSSETQGMASAMRMSFTADGHTWVYDPNGAGGSSGAATVFGLGSGEATATSDMFDLIKDTDKPVTVRIWLEGTDPNCTNMLKGANYSVSMRFEGIEEQ
ncbi:MAG: hypothetical protein UI917_08860 [Collinsella sp.]